MPTMNKGSDKTQVMSDSSLGEAGEPKNPPAELRDSKVEYDTQAAPNNSFELSKPKGEILVVATSRGFYDNRRISEGQKLTVRSFESLGQWMKCVDPRVELERLKFFKEKKQKIRSEAKEYEANIRILESQLKVGN